MSNDSSIKVRPPVPTRKVRERDSGAAARNSTAPATAAAASAGDAASRTSRVHPDPGARNSVRMSSLLVTGMRQTSAFKGRNA